MSADRLWITVRRNRAIGLAHYQGESDLDLQFELPDGRTVVASGCIVLNAPMSDTITATLPLKASKLMIIG
jgi:hypothetical protein